MKFSVLIPTQDRPHLASLCVRHALQSSHHEISVVVSDNSIEERNADCLRDLLSDVMSDPRLSVIQPSRILSAPEHFEFLLDFASGDYLLFLTDKMLLLPETLSWASDLIAKTNVELINWSWVDFVPSEFLVSPEGGTLTSPRRTPLGESDWAFFNCKEALSLKASGKIRRSEQSRDLYALGKVCFGTVSTSLVRSIRGFSGSLCLGATHDYAAMIQVLSSTPQGVFSNRPGMVFVNLPVDQSWGSRTALDSESAKVYFNSFSHIDGIVNELPVRGLYSSQSNMVAFDYERLLPRYGNQLLFDRRNWLRQMSRDLFEPGKTWISRDEKIAQTLILEDAIRFDWRLLWGFKVRKAVALVGLQIIPSGFRRALRCLRDLMPLEPSSRETLHSILSDHLPLDVASPSDAVKSVASILGQAVPT